MSRRDPRITLSQMLAHAREVHDLIARLEAILGQETP